LEPPAERVGRAGLEPADRSGASAREHDAALPRLPQHLLDAVRPPDSEHARRVAAADEDQVAGEQVVAPVGPRDAEEAHVRGAATVAGERLVEAGHEGVPGRCTEEADGRVLLAGETEEVVGERPHHAAGGDDRHAASVIGA
jgi:hypothetical protein